MIAGNRILGGACVLVIGMMISCSSEVNLGSDYMSQGTGAATSLPSEQGSGGSTDSLAGVGGQTGGADGAIEGLGGTDATEIALCDPNVPDCGTNCSSEQLSNCLDGLIGASCGCWEPCDEQYCAQCGAEVCEADELCVDGMCQDSEVDDMQPDNN